MKRYNKLYELKKLDYKAWYFEPTDQFRQFSTNLLHVDIAEEEFGWDEETALKNGAVRVTAFLGELGIESWKVPNDRLFRKVRDILEQNTLVPKITNTIWELGSSYTYYQFINARFFYSAKSIKDGEKM